MQTKSLLLIPLLAILIGCEIPDLDEIENTSWTIPVSLITSPDTLFMQDLSNSDGYYFNDSGVLVFSEEIDTVYVHVGDSLRWQRTSNTYQVAMPPIVFRNAGGCSSEAELSELFPAAEGLIGSVTQIEQSLEFSGARELSTADDLDWIAAREGSYYTINLYHTLPFALDELNLRLENSQSEDLGSTTLTATGGLQPGQTYSSVLPVSGLITNSNLMNLSGASLPMDAPALIENGSLQLELLISYCEADSARAIVQEQIVTHLDSLAGDERLNLDRALADSLKVQFITTNGLGVPIELELAFEDLCHDSLKMNPLVLNQSLAVGETVTSTHRDTLWIVPDRATGTDLQYLNFQANVVVPATESFSTLRSGDILELELAVDHARLRVLEGMYRTDQQVVIDGGPRDFDEFPPELQTLSMRDLDLLLGLDSDLRSDVVFSLDLGVTSRFSEQDTVYHIVTVLPGLSQELTVPRLGRVLSHLPSVIDVGGMVTIPAGQEFALRDTSEVGILSFRLPLELQINSLLWDSEPELSNDPVPEEMSQVTAHCWVRSRVPLGGSITAWASPSGVVGGDDAVELFDNTLAAAVWSEGSVAEVQDTLSFALSDAAVDVLRGDDWYTWFRFTANSQDEVIQLRNDQWLIVQLFVELEYDVDLHGEE